MKTITCQNCDTEHEAGLACPHCNVGKFTREYFAACGAKGGSAKGKRKARSTKQATKAARAGAKARWAKHKKTVK